LSAHAAPVRPSGPPFVAALGRVASDSWLAVAIAAAVCAVCFGATEGIETTDGIGLVPNTVVQMSLTVGAGVLIAAAAALRPRGAGRLWGMGCAAALFALGIYTAFSLIWSVDPANSWIEANRSFAYAATFAGAVAAVRLIGHRWRSVIAGVLLATIAVSLYALASKVFPASLDAADVYARISQPFGYWNAVGLTAALGVVPCLWLGARREGHGVLSALAAPALCALIVTLMLSYSRGALIAAAIGAALWFVLVPLRLRAVAVLAIGALAAAPVVIWTYRQPLLTDDHVALGSRTFWGHRFGLILAAALVAAFVAAVLARFAADRWPLSAAARRRLGIALLVALALVPFAAAGVLAHSQRGLGGSISHAWNTLTNPHATQPVTNPGRLVDASNDHALYWSYALDVFRTSPAIGAGAGAYPIADQRFMTGPALAMQAHSYVFQTLADLGLVGLALSLVVVGAWLVASLRAIGPLRPRAPGADVAERIGIVTLAAVVVTFTVHSATDWTWFVPGDAIVGLFCAGWVAGRGPIGPRMPRLSLRGLSAARPLAIAAALAALAIAFLTAWAQWQPLRSEQATDAGNIALGNAQSAITNGDTAQGRRELAIARQDELTAIARNPLDITPLSALGYVYAFAGQDNLAHATFLREVRLQPSNTNAWQDLAQYYSAVGDYAAATDALGTALYLAPQQPDLKRQYLETLTQASARH
jgi:tetratricopeptide (TPR) repeat protein